MEQDKFQEIACKAFDALPEAFRQKLENIEIVIEDEPDMELARSMKLGSRGHLLGLYQGVPLKARTHYYGMVLPDKITLYKKNIERVCSMRGLDVYEEVKHVLQHEIAHHFGISDQRLRDLGTY